MLRPGDLQQLGGGENKRSGATDDDDDDDMRGACRSCVRSVHASYAPTSSRTCALLRMRVCAHPHERKVQRTRACSYRMRSGNRPSSIPLFGKFPSRQH